MCASRAVAEVAGGAPRVGVPIVQLGAGEIAVDIVVAAGDQDGRVGQQRGGVPVAGNSETPVALHVPAAGS